LHIYKLNITVFVCIRIIRGWNRGRLFNRMMMIRWSRGRWSTWLVAWEAHATTHCWCRCLL